MKETNRNAASLWWARRLAIGCTSASLAIVVAWVALPWLPMPRGLEDPVDSMPSTQVVDRLGAPLRTVAGANGTISCTLTESDVPRGIVLATLAAEDARFRSHPGFDARAIVRAAWQRARQGRVVSGASTITQQLVKLGDPRPRTLWNKAREAVLAARLERTWDKERILRSYLARINYGGRCAGLSEASRAYFGKPPAALDLAESAFLAAIPQAPARLGPWQHPERTKARQAWILRRCHRLGWIDDDELARALAEPIRLMPPGREFHAPHFVDQALAFRRPGFPAGRVPTTLDLSLQSRCEAIVRSHLAALRPMHVGESAVVVLENTSGGVLALVGSPDWRAPISGQVDGTRARRSPGSALKPFAYLLAIEDGATAADVLPDIPTRFATSTGLFEPLNYDRRFRGPVTLRTALANSLNVPAVRILADHGGPSRLLDLLAAMGVAKPSRPVEEIGLGLVLGGAEVSLLELTGAYATLARLGVWIPTRLEPGPSPHGKRVASEDACWLLADILADPGARAECFGLETPLRAGFRFACKTGTSTGYRDNWALGFTPEFTVGVWTGNFDGSPMNGVSGVSGAAPILGDIMEELHARFGTTWFPRPKGVRAVRVEPLNGCADPSGREELFLSGRGPTRLAEPSHAPSGRVQLGPEYAEWFASNDNRLGLRAALRPSVPRGRPRIVSPLPGTVYLVDRDLPTSTQGVILRAESEVEWKCSTLLLSRRGASTEARLAPGRHHIEAVSADGAIESTWIDVRLL